MTATMHTCEHKEVSLTTRFNRVFQMDPTKTLTIRKRFAAEMRKPDRNPLLSLTAKPLKTNAPARKGAFNFTKSAQKVEGFMDWLRTEVDKGILEVHERVGFRVLERTPWMNTFIDSAYKKGLKRADSELRKAGITPVSELGPEPRFSITSAFNRPMHADRVALIYTRAFEELQGVTAQMSQQISRTLAKGMAEGKGPRELARQINDRITKIGRVRAETIARTEVIRAHHSANIGMYREANVEGVKVKAEWSTAGDDRVCADCAFMEGRIFTIDEIEDLIPFHPNCRCIALPANVGEEPRDVTFEDREKLVGEDALNKDGQFSRQGFFEDKTGKKLPGAPAPGDKVKQ